MPLSQDDRSEVLANTLLLGVERVNLDGTDMVKMMGDRCIQRLRNIVPLVSSAKLNNPINLSGLQRCLSLKFTSKMYCLVF